MTRVATAWITSALAVLQVSSLGAQRITRRESHGEVRNRVSITTVIAAIDNAPETAARIATLPPLTPNQIRIVDVRPYVGSSVRRNYATALEHRAGDIEAVRAALVLNDTVAKVLRGHNPPITVDHVVAAGLLDVIETAKSSDAVVLYVDRTNKIGLASEAAAPAGRALMSFKPTTTTLLTAIQMSPEMVARVSVLPSLRLDRVRFVDIGEIVTADESEAYERVVRQNEFAIRSLRAELSKWPIIVHALKRHNAKLALGDVYAADILGNNDALLLYVKSPAPAAAPPP